MQAIIERVDNNTFIAKGESNHWVVLDTKKEFGGNEGASTPMEMVLFALGGCTGMDVQSILTKMREPVTRFRIIISAQRRDEHPRIFTEIKITYQFWGENLNPANLQKAIELSQTKYCSVSAMLKSVAQISYEIQINPKD